MAAALIIAGGKTDRKDKFSPEKQIGRITAIERIVLLLRLSGIQRIVVVGDEDELPKKLVSSMNLIFLVTSPPGEMLDSIKQGLLYLKDKCTEVLIAYVDVPMFSKKTVQMLLAADENICIPSYRGHCGHPVLLRLPCFEGIISYQGSKGLKGAIEASGFKRQIVETNDAGVLANGQHGTFYESLLAGHDIMKMRASFQIKVSKERGFYGPSAHHLLQLIEELGSLSNACQYMGMSYTKGRKIIRTMEEQLGVPVLESRQGGKDGGYSRLTKEAKKMMKSYSAFEKEAEATLQAIFQKHFSQFDE